MLNELEIKELVDNAIKALKDFNRYDAGKKKKQRYPEYNKTYKEQCEMAERVEVHASSDHFPESLFKTKAPNEDPAQFEWRKQNYQPITRPYWNRAANVVNRVWNEQNYSIGWAEGQQEQANYFDKDYPQYRRLTNYFRQVVSRMKLEDPNAIAVVRPSYIPYKSTTLESGEVISEVDVTQEIEPIVVVFECEEVIHFVPGKLAMVELEEKSELNSGNGKKEKEGIIYEIYDDVAIYRATQVGRKGDYTFEITLWYEHAWGYVPAWKLTGIPIYEDGCLLYKSPYYDAIPVLDTALYDSSTLAAAKITGAFPVWWEYVDKCNAVGCIDGKVNKYGEDGYAIIGTTNCSVCNGTGKGQRRSVFGTYEVAIPDRLNEQNVQTPPLGYVALDPKILEFLRTEIETNCNTFYTMLNIDLSPSFAKGDETALGKQIDREEMFSFLLQFANEVFTLMHNCIDAIGFMRYGEPFKSPNIKSPRTFSIRSESDLTDELKIANDTNLPPQFKLSINKEALQVRFPNDKQQIVVFDIVAYCDGLFEKSDADINLGLANGSIKPVENILHRYILQFIANKEKAFFEKDNEAQRVELMADAQKRLDELNPTRFTDIIPPVA